MRFFGYWIALIILYFSTLNVFSQAIQPEKKGKLYVGYLHDNLYQLINGKIGSVNAFYNNNFFINYQYNDRLSGKLIVGIPIKVFSGSKFFDNNSIAFNAEYIFHLSKNKLLLGLGFDIGNYLQNEPMKKRVSIFNIGIFPRFYYVINNRFQFIFEPICISHIRNRAHFISQSQYDYEIPGISFTKLLALGIQIKL